MRRIVFMLVMALLLTGCSIAQPFKAASNVENTKKLRVGMTKEQVLKIMGTPVSGEAFVSPDVWYYYDQTVWADGLTTEDECFPVVFENGKLIGWGRVFAVKHHLQKLEREEIKIPED